MHSTVLFLSNAFSSQWFSPLIDSYRLQELGEDCPKSSVSLGMAKWINDSLYVEVALSQLGIWHLKKTNYQEFQSIKENQTMTVQF